jgi:hypothetical protein
LDLTVAELMRSDGASLAQFRRLAERRVGQTLLRDYFPGTDDGAEKAISVWTSRVGERIRRLLGPSVNPARERIWDRIEGLLEKNGSER